MRVAVPGEAGTWPADAEETSGDAVGEPELTQELRRGGQVTNAGVEGRTAPVGATVEKHLNAIFTELELNGAPVHRRVAAVLAYLTG